MVGVRSMVAVLLGVGFLLGPLRAFGEELSDVHQGPLPEVLERLVPYEPGGTTLEALSGLERLGRGLDRRLATTARFLRAAVATELFVFATIHDDHQQLQALSLALGGEGEGLVDQIEGALREAATGSFARETESYLVVLRCAGSDVAGDCRGELRSVREGGRAGAAAARLLFVEEILEAAERSRRGDEASLEAVSTRLCEEEGLEERAQQRCAQVERGDSERTIAAARVRVVMRSVEEQLGELDRLAALGEPLSQLARPWVAQAEERLGWSVVPRALSPTSLDQLTLPSVMGAPAVPPLQLLVVGPRGASVALSPTSVETGRGSLDLDERAGYALPGRQVVSPPVRFRPVIRPIEEVTRGLVEMRRALEQTTAEVSGEGPTWTAAASQELGLVVDGDVNLIDLARYVASAERAGYRRFALLGRRPDGRLASVAVEFGSVQEGTTPRDLPRLRVAPTAVRFSPSEGPPIEVPRDELVRLGEALRPLLASGQRSFAAQARPMMPLRMVLPSIDAVTTAAASGSSAVLFLLPP